MHAYPSKMRTIGEKLKSIADDAQANADAAKPGLEKAGHGNEGFTTVAASSTAAFNWLDHVHRVRVRIADAGGGLIRAADDIQGTDADNEGGLRLIPPAV